MTEIPENPDHRTTNAISKKRLGRDIESMMRVTDSSNSEN
jgi:hypothetical protein